jgi:hypothetical protein
MPRKKFPNLSVGRGEKLSVKAGGGLTAKGRAKANRATGSNLKAPTKIQALAINLSALEAVDGLESVAKQQERDGGADNGIHTKSPTWLVLQH